MRNLALKLWEVRVSHHLRILLSFALLGTVSCSSSSKHPVAGGMRGVASTDPASAVSPVTGQTFRQELEGARGPKLVKPKLQVFGHWVRANPIATFTDLLKNAPVLELEKLPIKDSPYPHTGTTVVSSYADVVEILNKPTLFTVRNYRKKMEDSVGPYMLSYDESIYNIKEKPWMRKMMPREDHPRIRATVREIVNRAIAEQQFVGTDVNGRVYGRLELVNQIARKVPIELSARYFGFPGPSEEKMYEWSRATQDDFFHHVSNDEKEVREAAVRAGKEMHAYLKDLIAQKQKNPTGDDILSRLIQTENDFVKPKSAEDDRIRTNIMGTLVGGVETTQAAIVQSLAQLFNNPAALAAARDAALRDDVETVGKYVWEALRFDPVNPFVVRYAEEDYVLASGARIKKGHHVLVATHAAMLDPKMFAEPLQFNPNRDQSKFFHLGYGHHRCLGDYVAMIEVPEVVMALLKLPGLKPATGQAGKIDNRYRLPRAGIPKFRTSFPEKFSVEFEVTRAPADMEIADADYAYEDYLMNFDRNAFRQCMAGFDPADPTPDQKRLRKTVQAMRHNIGVAKINNVPRVNRHILFCRMNVGFQNCMKTAAKERKFKILVGDTTHATAYQTCKVKHPLSETEGAFYEHVLLGQRLRTESIRSDQARRNTGEDYMFEDHLKFYDRYFYRLTMMNPAAIRSFPNSRDLLFYARLNLDFRLCMGLPVVAHGLTGGRVGANRDTQYDKCKDGVLDEDSGNHYGALSNTEKYYYETLILGRNVTRPTER